MTTNIQDIIEMDESELFTVVGTSDEEIEKLESTPYSYWRAVWKNLFHNKAAICCLILVAIIIFLSIFGTTIKSGKISGFNPNPDRYASPSSEHWFGTNRSGHDIWTLIWTGAGFSLLLAAVSSVINIVIGIVVGGLWGYFRKMDRIMIELFNVINNIPSLLIYLLIMKLIYDSNNGQVGFWHMVFVLCLFGWMGLASMMRNQIIIIRNREFNIASETLGSSPMAIISHNMLPNLVSIIVQVISGFIPGSIGMEVSLKYFGLLPPTLITLGQVLNNAVKEDYLSHPHVLIFPTIILMVITIAFFYFGLAMADATDPKTHR